MTTTPSDRNEDHRADRPQDEGRVFILDLEGEYGGRFGPFPSRSIAWEVHDALGPRMGSAEVWPVEDPASLIARIADDLNAEGLRIVLTEHDLIPFDQRATPDAPTTDPEGVTP